MIEILDEYRANISFGLTLHETMEDEYAIQEQLYAQMMGWA